MPAHDVVVNANYTTDIFSVKSSSIKYDDIYNLQGQKVRSNATSLKGLPKGIYIINGSKVVVK